MVYRANREHVNTDKTTIEMRDSKFQPIGGHSCGRRALTFRSACCYLAAPFCVASLDVAVSLHPVFANRAAAVLSGLEPSPWMPLTLPRRSRPQRRP